jgi:hypothetical protein
MTNNSTNIDEISVLMREKYSERNRISFSQAPGQHPVKMKKNQLTGTRMPEWKAISRKG